MGQRGGALKLALLALLPLIASLVALGPTHDFALADVTQPNGCFSVAGQGYASLPLVITGTLAPKPATKGSPITLGNTSINITVASALLDAGVGFHLISAANSLANIGVPGQANTANNGVNTATVAAGSATVKLTGTNTTETTQTVTNTSALSTTFYAVTDPTTGANTYYSSITPGPSATPVPTRTGVVITSLTTIIALADSTWHAAATGTMSVAQQTVVPSSNTSPTPADLTAAPVILPIGGLLSTPITFRCWTGTVTPAVPPATLGTFVPSTPLAIDTVTVNGPPGPPGCTTPQATSVDGGKSVTVTPSCTDANPPFDLATSTVTIVTAPAHGTAAVQAGNTILYTNDGNGANTDTFTYRVSNGTAPPLGASNPVTVNVSVNVPGPPVCTTPQATSVDGGQSVTVTPSCTDTNPPFDLATSTVTIVTAPAHGTAAAQAGNTILYTNDGNGASTDSFTYRVSNGTTPPLGSSNLVTVNVSLVNTPQSGGATQDNGCLSVGTTFSQFAVPITGRTSPNPIKFGSGKVTLSGTSVGISVSAALIQAGVGAKILSAADKLDDITTTAGTNTVTSAAGGVKFKIYGGNSTEQVQTASNPAAATTTFYAVSDLTTGNVTVYTAIDPPAGASPVANRTGTPLSGNLSVVIPLSDTTWTPSGGNMNFQEQGIKPSSNTAPTPADQAAAPLIILSQISAIPQPLPVAFHCWPGTVDPPPPTFVRGNPLDFAMATVNGGGPGTTTTTTIASATSGGSGGSGASATTTHDLAFTGNHSVFRSLVIGLILLDVGYLLVFMTMSSRRRRAKQPQRG